MVENRAAPAARFFFALIRSFRKAPTALVETSRYDRFAHTFSDVVKAVGTIRKIAGNEETVVSFAATARRADRAFPAYWGLKATGCLSEDCRSRTIAARQADC
ncbi:hypothetical protein [Rhizobium mongolense]|uniref:hypothetical protein n=1 Tax=Rhizobium mongolense TaxID=57676 RepID=UPI0034A4F369